MAGSFARPFLNVRSSAPFFAPNGEAIVANMFKSNPNALTTLQRYLAQNQGLYNKLWRELKAAKQIENEATYARTLVRSLRQPMPDHPAATTDPQRNQYGYLPDNLQSTMNLRAVAREGAAVPH